MADNYSNRRVLPRLVMPMDDFTTSSAALLCSGDFNYFMKYGLALIASKLKNASDCDLIINCVDFPIHIASQTVSRFLSIEPSESGIYFTKTDTSVISNITLDAKACYLRTIRYYVAHSIMNKFPVSLAIIDIDSLIVNPSFSNDFSRFLERNYSFVVGSRSDFTSLPLYEASSKGYLWRTVKAGFSFFQNEKFGLYAIERVYNSLFNTNDDIPPLEPLKMYRAYYEDQICLLLTFLELLSVPTKNRTTNHLSCIGDKKSDFVSFTRDFSNSSLWIPPASARDKKVFAQYFNFD